MTDRMLLGILCLLLSCPGCRLAGSSFAMNSDSGIPFLGFSMAPKQSEPEMEFARRKTPLPPRQQLAEKSSSGNILTRWKTEAKEEERERIELPRTDIDDETGEELDESLEGDEAEGDAFSF